MAQVAAEPVVAPRQPRTVLMSPELMDEWATRDAQGVRLSWDWGQPDAAGLYTPTITRHYDDKLIEPGVLREVFDIVLARIDDKHTDPRYRETKAYTDGWRDAISALRDDPALAPAAS